MSETNTANPEMADLWNGPGARSWIAAQTVLDQTFAGFETLLADMAAQANARAVLDVGCGTGATTRAIARRIALEGTALGFDLSAPMIAQAKVLADQEGSTAGFLAGDAQTHKFPPAAFDLIVSRFGVMFFSDPVGAFANLRSAARPGAALAMISWRSITENPFMTVAERAAAPFLPDLPKRGGGPGQFAFADQDYVHGILDASGWTGVSSEALDMPCAFPASELDTYLGLMGPVGQMLAKKDEAMRERVISAIREGFKEYISGSDIQFTAACWLTRATA
ncbi:class I SAM-dependent methyltransferase [Hyphomonas sp.]|uniref:class I SAM-dependent methyltransferase n=1 Tax=Hyphomonas sp. TaxID=87 RepID=UPI0035281CBE